MPTIVLPVRIIHYLPIITTVISAIFCAQLFRRYHLRRSGPHLLWWGAGMFAYGLRRHGFAALVHRDRGRRTGSKDV